MTTFVEATDAGWTLIGTALTRVLIQASGDIYVHIAGSAPGATAAGFLVESGVPVHFGDISTFGGGVWVKAAQPASRIAGTR